MKILITGGAGFIASHVADHYLRNGYQVSILDNLSTGKKKFVNSQAQFFEADICNQEQVQEIIAQVQPEVINHHAAHIQVGYSVKDPQFDAQNNVLGLLNLMEAAKDHGLKKVIMASTGGAMYGNKETPFVETMKEKPLSPYGVSKRAGELYLNYYCEQYGIPYISLRYSNVYGPRQNPHGESGVIAIFSEMIAQGKQPTINGDGTHTRDYVYIDDVAKANVLALDSDFVGELNIGTGVETSTNQVYDQVVKEFGVDLPAQHGPERPGEQVTSALDFSKAKKLLGWQPEVEFEQGVRQVVEWYQQKSESA
ncbi:MAG: NAD-dependent epimerase/dehydratase family protein [Candidatus Pacebacteria bacterium]|nr:NAD-dependent epimerase/dehydratase family protein [Candidatus Paceibacterota bacterium]